MRIFKKLAALILSIAMICSFAMPAFAAGEAPKAPGVSYVFAKFARGGDKPVGISSITFDASNTSELKELAIYQELPNGAVGNHYKTLSAVTFTNNDNNVFKTKLFNKPDNGDFEAIEIVPKGNGTETLTAVVEGKEISINITIKNYTKPEYFFSKYMHSSIDNPPADAEKITGTQTINVGEAAPNDLEFAIYSSDNKKNPIKLVSEYFDVSDKTVLTLGMIGDQAIVIRSRKAGENVTVTYDDPELGIKQTLTLTLTNVPELPETQTSLVRLNQDGSFLNTQNKITDSKGHGTWHNMPYAFAEIKYNAPQGENPFIKFLTPTDLEVEITRDDLNGAVVTDKDTIYLDKVNGMDVIRMNPQGNPGIYRIWFYYTSPIASENTGRDSKNGKCGKYFVYDLLPPAEEVHVEVKQGESIQAAIDKIGKDGEAPESTDKSITFILLTGKTYDEDIVVNKKVFITGDVDGNDTSNYPVLTGSVVFDAEEHRGHNKTANARVGNLKLQSRKHREGTGIKVNDGKFGVASIPVEGFAVGAEKSGSNASIGCDFTDCTIGYKVDMSGFDYNVSRTTAHTFTGNDTAIQLTGASDGHSGMFIFNNNFVNNGIDVEVQGQNNSYTLYVAYNYHTYNTLRFGYDADLADHFINVDKVSPYYREAVRFQGSEAFTPEKSYALPTDLADLPINSSMADKPIDTANFPEKVKISIVSMGETVGAPIARWDFAATDSSKAGTFNPAIATELKDSSSNAVDTLPDGATYQPVSFAHSGALPGTATINVAKDADAPTQNLKLYKVVGNKLVLQPEAVTFANGEYIFRRDGASDYLITDTDVTGSNDDDDDDSSGSSGGSNDYVGSEEINNKLESTTGSNVSISVAGKPIVSASLFDTLKTNPGKTITLKGDGYAWSFKGSDIKGNIPGLISFNTNISSTSPNAEEIKKVTGDAEIVNVYFSYHGQLPGKATVELAVDKKYNGKTLNFYHYNAAKKQLETVATGLAVKDGKVSVSITHCSDYILSPVALKATAPVTQMVTNPETGAVDRVPLAIALAALSCLGALTILRVKKPE